MHASSLPKLSYVLLTHNREKYVRSALENAFAQEYAGELEYIISDDCSTDRTYDIIREVADAYAGSRRVLVTQTPRNLHLAGNTNHALQYVTGDWIIRADDDDYSSLDRCSVIAAAIAAHPNATAVATGMRPFASTEEPEIRRLCSLPCADTRETIVTDIFRGDHGPAAFNRPVSHKAWSMKIFNTFGDLPAEGYYIDDLTCFFRSLMLGPHITLPGACCVFARDDGSNMSRGASGPQHTFSNLVAYERFLIKYYTTTAPLIAAQIEQYRRYMQQNLPPATHPQVESYLADMQLEVDQRVTDGSHWQRTTWQRLVNYLGREKKDAYSLLRCLPLPLFAALASTYRRLARR